MWSVTQTQNTAVVYPEWDTVVMISMGLLGIDYQDCISPLCTRLEDGVRIIRKQQLASPKEINKERKLFLL